MLFLLAMTCSLCADSLQAQLLTNTTTVNGLTMGAFSDDGDFKKKKKKKKKKKGGGDKFFHGAGLSLFYAPNNSEDDDNSTAAFGISYFPSFKIAEFGETMSLRLAATPGLGLAGSVNSREGGSLTFALDLPVAAELHLGDQEGEGTGGFVGAGFAYNRIASSEYGNNTALGPQVSAGIKVPFRERLWTLRGNFLINIKKEANDEGVKGRNVISFTLGTYF